jgi:hypothetical protein
VIERSSGLSVMRPLGVEKTLYSLGLLALVAAAVHFRALQSKVLGACIGLGLAAMLYKPGQFIVSGVWCSIAMLTPLIAFAGVVILSRSFRSNDLTPLQQRRIFLLASLAALCSFVQYPFAAPIYLCYSLPLTLLAATAIVTSVRKRTGTFVLTAVLGFYLLFGTFVLIPDHIYELTHKIGTLTELQQKRARGLRVEFAPEWDNLIGFLQQHSPNGLIYAGNDCAEFYFLTGLKNVTRVDGGASPAEVLKALQSDDLKLVVINEAPFFPDAKMSDGVREAIRQKFPEQRLIGIYRVFWRP